MSALDDYRNHVDLAQQAIKESEKVNTASTIHHASLELAQVHATLALAAATLAVAEEGRTLVLTEGADRA